MGVKSVASLRGVLVALLLFAGCGGSSDPGASSTATPAASPTPEETPKIKPPPDPCADYPPPFEATYLPEGFDEKLRKGAGLFKGTDYPTRGLVGHYLGETDGIHVNFQVRNGPLPYEPANRRPLRGVLDRRGQIGKVEGGWAVEFSLDSCEFRMDTYGIDRAETVKVAKGLREKD